LATFKRPSSLEESALETPPRTPFDPSRSLAFMHIPKTAGTSLTAALICALSPDVVVAGFDRAVFGDFADFATLDEATQQQLLFLQDVLPAAVLIAGHISLSFFQGRFAGSQFMTVLREPSCRILSHWLFWRGFTEEQLSPWGGWATRVRQARKPLVEFLREPSVACQTDNLTVRMLLWPHKLIPDDDFINPRHSDKLLAEARDRLQQFEFADVVENPQFPDQLRTWLGRPFGLGHENATRPVPTSLRQPFADALTEEAIDLLSERSLLDLELWKDVVARSLPGSDPHQLRQQTLLHTAARYGALMASS
jgi:hypothetical protein